jgi:hypothetical protein
MITTYLSMSHILYRGYNAIDILHDDQHIFHIKETKNILNECQAVVSP